MKVNVHRTLLLGSSKSFMWNEIKSSPAGPFPPTSFQGADGG